MSRQSSKRKGKGKRPPSPNPATSDGGSDDGVQNQIVPSKKLRIVSPERINSRLFSSAQNATSSSSKGLAGFASLINRSSLSAAKTETNRGLKSSTSGRLGRAGANAKSALQMVNSVLHHLAPI